MELFLCRPRLLMLPRLKRKLKLCSNLLEWDIICMLEIRYFMLILMLIFGTSRWLYDYNFLLNFDGNLWLISIYMSSIFCLELLVCYCLRREGARTRRGLGFSRLGGHVSVANWVSKPPDWRGRIFGLHFFWTRTKFWLD